MMCSQCFYGFCSIQNGGYCARSYSQYSNGKYCIANSNCQTSSSSSSTKTEIIIGIVVSVISIILIIAFRCWWIRRNSQQIVQSLTSNVNLNETRKADTTIIMNESRPTYAQYPPQYPPQYPSVNYAPVPQPVFVQPTMPTVYSQPVQPMYDPYANQYAGNQGTIKIQS